MHVDDVRIDEGGDGLPAFVASTPRALTFAAGPGRRRDRLRSRRRDRPPRPADGPATPPVERPAARRGPGWRLIRLSVAVVRWGCIALVAVVVLGSAVATAFGYRVMVVSSASMAPAIKAGDAVVVATTGTEDVRAGDIVTFGSAGAPRLTTHRVVSLRRVDGKLYYQTLGDANEDPDPNLTLADDVLGRVVYRIPGIGEELVAIASPRGKLIALGIPVASVVVEELFALAPLLRRRRRLFPAAEAQPRSG